MKKYLAIFMTVSMMFGTVGCSGPVTKQDVGTVTGGVVGGLIGSQFGGGTGQVVAGVVGAVAGAVIGGAIGKNMDEVDQMKTVQALNANRTNSSSTWTNPDTNNTYTVTPTRTYYEGSQPCREYTTTAIIGGKKQQVYGTACRQADGSWKAAS